MIGIGRMVLTIFLSVFFTMLIIVLIKKLTANKNIPFVSSISEAV